MFTVDGGMSVQLYPQKLTVLARKVQEMEAAEANQSQQMREEK